MFSITVLVSGGGTNLQAIIDSTAGGELKDAGVFIKKVISNKSDAFALERAKKAGIKTGTLDASGIVRYDNREILTEPLV